MRHRGPFSSRPAFQRPAISLSRSTPFSIYAFGGLNGSKIDPLVDTKRGKVDDPPEKPTTPKPGTEAKPTPSPDSPKPAKSPDDLILDSWNAFVQAVKSREQGAAALYQSDQQKLFADAKTALRLEDDNLRKTDSLKTPYIGELKIRHENWHTSQVSGKYGGEWRLRIEFTWDGKDWQPIRSYMTILKFSDLRGMQNSPRSETELEQWFRATMDPAIKQLLFGDRKYSLDFSDAKNPRAIWKDEGPR